MKKRIIITLALVLAVSPFAQARDIIVLPPKPPGDRPLVQVALLLDNSGSMSGLIDQAKSRLWTFINEFALSRKNGKPPIVQVALFIYGNPPPRMLTPLTDDLDSVSEKLFAVTISGGSEHCGQVIDAATRTLSWSTRPDDLKVIFIAGNEPFTQGPIHYREACKAAISKGIIVNTIHCGDESAGVGGMWKDGAMLADGRFFNINHNRQIVHIETPHDVELLRLNSELNTTYVAYGVAGMQSAARQATQDANAASLSPSSALGRVSAKSSAQYRNSNWDLVDAMKEGTVKLGDVKDEDLPENMRGMTAAQREQHVKEQQTRRTTIQTKIRVLTELRNKYVAEQRRQSSSSGAADTLETAMIKAVREQAAAKRFQFRR